MTILVGAITVAATIVFGYLTALRAQYERVLNVIDYISSSDVAGARHRLGLLIYSDSPVPEEEIPDRVGDLFTILWAFGRVNAVRESLPRTPRMIARLAGGPQQLLRSNVEPWSHFWQNHLESVSQRLKCPDIEGSDNGLTALTEAWPPPRG